MNISQPFHQKLEAAPNPGWQSALSFYRDRGTVIFLSYCRFWEKHAFVQQSLAKHLEQVGVSVIWLDGTGWKPYFPKHYWYSSRLKIRQLFRYPGERFSWVKRTSISHQANYLKHLIAQKGKPVVWVQGGIEETLAEKLPYIDVFSTFDDPYRHSPEGALCSKAKLILCQNTLAYDRMRRVHYSKSKLAHPPVDLGFEHFGHGPRLELPSNFPSLRMGYVGSFFEEGYDFDLFEKLMQTYPNVGFILAGRTDKGGMQRVKEWRRYLNFHHFPWVPRTRIGSTWKLLNVCLLLYRPNRTQDGAYPVKVVEALKYKVACVGTIVPKNQDLSAYVALGSTPEKLLELAKEAAEKKDEKTLEKHFQSISKLLDPREHLCKVSDFLSHR